MAGIVEMERPENVARPCFAKDDPRFGSPRSHRASRFAEAMISRRSMLGGALVAPLMSGCMRAASINTLPPALGLADLTIMAQLKADYRGTVSQVATWGYTHFGFRLAGYSAQDANEPTPHQKAEMVREAGLQVGVVRYGMGGDFASQAEAAAEIGAYVLAYSAAPVFFRGKQLGETSRAEFDAWLPELGEMARIATANGLRLAYHNHWWDHVALGGRSPLDLIAERYSAEQVAFEIDLAWAWIGGVDPLELVSRLGERVIAMHFKDVDPARGRDRMEQLVAPGRGRLDYPTLIPLIDRATQAIGYVEIDRPQDGVAEAREAARVIRSARGELVA